MDNARSPSLNNRDPRLIYAGPSRELTACLSEALIRSAGVEYGGRFRREDDGIKARMGTELRRMCEY